MNRKTLLAAVFAAALAAPALAGAGHEHPGEHPAPAKKAAAPKAKAAGETVTIEGEVLDLVCFMGHDGKGEKHGNCAKQCVVEGGAPAGLLGPDGTVYLLVEDHGKKKPFDAARRLAGEKAKVSGRLSKKGGLQAIIVTEAEKAK